MRPPIFLFGLARKERQRRARDCGPPLPGAGKGGPESPQPRPLWAVAKQARKGQCGKVEEERKGRVRAINNSVSILSTRGCPTWVRIVFKRETCLLLFPRRASLTLAPLPVKIVGADGPGQPLLPLRGNSPSALIGPHIDVPPAGRARSRPVRAEKPFFISPFPCSYTWSKADAAELLPGSSAALDGEWCECA